MHWINFLHYEWFKHKSGKWVWMSMGFTLMWCAMLVYFSQLWVSPLERQLDSHYLKQYYLEQSSYLAYLLIGFHIIHTSLGWLGDSNAYLEVMFGWQYRSFKFGLFGLETVWLVLWHFVLIQLVYGLAFGDWGLLSHLGLKLIMNACVFSGFVVLWLRIKSNYSMLFGLLVLVIHPNIQHITWGYFKIADWLPYTTTELSLHPILGTMTYYWVGFNLSLIKPK